MDALHKLKQKLKSQTGASITFALLLFLVCAVVGSTVLVAGTAAAGRMSKVAEMDQRYYAVNSAARLLVDLMERDEIRYQVKEAVPAGQSTGGTGGDTTGGSDDSGEEYEWFIKNGDTWTSPNDSDPLPLTLFLAKRALSMSENATGNTSFTIKPQLTTAGVKLNVTAQATITNGEHQKLRGNGPIFRRHGRRNTMKKIQRKLHSNLGESLSETLVAVLLITLALTMLAAMISSTASLVKTSEKKMNAYYENNAQLETFASPAGKVKVEISLGDGTGAASSGELESPEVDYVSNVEFSKTPVVAYRLSAGE